MIQSPVPRAAVLGGGRLYLVACVSLSFSALTTSDGDLRSYEVTEG